MSVEVDGTVFYDQSSDHMILDPSRRRLHTRMKLDDPWRIPWVARPYLHWNLVCVGAIATCLILDDSWLWRLMMEHLNVKILINKLSNSDEKITPTFHTFITEEITEIELLKKKFLYL